MRLDTFLAEQDLGLSRSSLQKLIKDGAVTVNGEETRPSHRLQGGEFIEVILPPPEDRPPEPEPIPLDVIYEDDDVLVINKQKGLVVHPAAGAPTGTLVNALLYRGVALPTLSDEQRPGIVHRLDKDTSGAMVVAKSDRAYLSLGRQFREKAVKRVYLALVHGVVKDDRGIVEAPIGRHAVVRQKMAVVRHGGREAYTHYRVVERFSEYTLLECRLETGRTHQIRVHMAHIGHPIVGDPVYGPSRCPFPVDGQLLHARRLGFIHPGTGEFVEFEAPLPPDMERVLEELRSREGNGLRRPFTG